MFRSVLIALILGLAAIATTLSTVGFFGWQPDAAANSQRSPNEESSDTLSQQLQQFSALLRSVAKDGATSDQSTPVSQGRVPTDDHVKRDNHWGNTTETTLPDGRKARVDRITGEIVSWDARTPEEAKRFGFDFDFRRSDYATYGLVTLEQLADGGDYIAMMYVAEVRARERDYDAAKRLWLTSATISGQTRGLANAAAHFFSRRNYYDSLVFSELAVRLGDNLTYNFGASAKRLMSQEDVEAAEQDADRIFESMLAGRRLRIGEGF